MATIQQGEHRVAEDVALYVCQCGLHFNGAATTSVTCPRCGAVQAW